MNRTFVMRGLYNQGFVRIIKKIYLTKLNAVLIGFVIVGLHLGFTIYSINDA